MKIQILCVGKIKDSYNKTLIEDYCRRIRKKNHSIEIKEYPDLKIPERINENQIETLLEKECEKMIKSISDKDYVIALCVEGKEITTKKHGEYVKKALNAGKHVICEKPFTVTGKEAREPMDPRGG